MDLQEVLDFLKLKRDEGHNLDSVITLLEREIESQNEPSTGDTV